MKDKKPKISRWALEMSSWDAKIILVKGSVNVEADALSRAPVPPLAEEVTWFNESPEVVYAPVASLFDNRLTRDTFMQEQGKDELCQEITAHVNKSKTKESKGYRIIDGILKKRIRFKLLPSRTETFPEIQSYEDLPKPVVMSLIGMVNKVLGVSKKTSNKEECQRKDSPKKNVHGTKLKIEKQGTGLGKGVPAKGSYRSKTGPDQPSVQESTMKRTKRKMDSTEAERPDTMKSKSMLKPTAKQYGEYFVPVIPESLQPDIMYMFHDSTYAGHLSATATARKIKERAYWNFMDKAIREYCRECSVCQESKSTNHLPFGLLQPVQPPSHVFEVIHVDLLGPLPKSGGGRLNEYLFVIVDSLSKWVEFFPIRTPTAKKLSEILEDQIFCRYGVPAMLVSDCGSQFISRLFETTCKDWNVQHRFTAPYHHQANQSERVNRNIVEMLRAYVRDNHRDWDIHIQKFAFALRTTVHETTKCTPALLQLGREIPFAFDREMNGFKTTEAETTLEKLRSLPEDLKNHIEWVRDNIKKMQESNKKSYDKRHIDHPFKTGDKVLIRNHTRSDKAAHKIQKLLRKWIGPSVLGSKSKDNDVTFEILTIPDMRNVGRRHVSDLKPFVQRKTVRRRFVVSPRVENVNNSLEPIEDLEEQPARPSRRVKTRLNYRTLAGYNIHRNS